MPPIEPSRSFARNMLSNLASRSLPTTITPTSTLNLAQKIHEFASRTLLPRLATDVSTVPEGYGRTASGPAPGAVAGIVLGSVAGFILLLWIIYWCVNLGSPAPHLEEGSVSGVGGSSSVVSYRSRPRVRRHRHSHKSSQQYSPHRRKETVEITRRDRTVRRSPSSSPARVPEVDQIVVLEEHNRSRSRSRPLSRSRSRSRSISRPRPAPTRSDGDDEIVVLEEHTPPRRGSRGYRRRSSERRSSAQYRDVEYRRRSSSRR